MSEHVDASGHAPHFAATPGSAGATYGRWLVHAAAIVCALSIIGAGAELLAGPAYRFGWVTLKPGLQTIRWAATGEAVVFVIALIGCLLALRRRALHARNFFLCATAISLLAASQPALLWYRVQHLPHIHDISTDTTNPPEYVAVLPLRSSAPNPTRYDPRQVTQQRESYPDIVPMLLAAPPDQVFPVALRIAREMGWEIVAANPDALRIEATDTSFLFGFKDDVVIGIAAERGGSRVDLRSLSRVGGSDFGVNARRIRNFVTRLQAATA